MISRVPARPQAARPCLMPSGPRLRDVRVDALRGLALLMIFVDHIPGDALNWVTLHNFGLCDAAEVFVTLAGFSSMMAYGTMFDRSGVSAKGLRKIAARCGRIYVVQVVLLILTLSVVRGWSAHFNIPPRAVAPILDQGPDGLFRALTLRSLPGYIDILPLYIVLLAGFPLLYLLMRRHIGLALLVSVAIWGAANLDHRLTLPNTIDGNGWYFNPFTWQLLFTVGAALAVLMARQAATAGAVAPADLLPRFRWLAALCWAYLIFAFFQGALWTEWHLPDLRPFDMAPPDKSHLSPLRIIDIMALLYLFLSSTLVSRLLANGLARLIGVCGRHSLEVFAVGCACALLGRLMFRTFGSGLWMQIGINVVGIAAMCGAAMWLEHTRLKKDRKARLLRAQAQDPAFHEGGFGVYRAG